MKEVGGWEGGVMGCGLVGRSMGLWCGWWGLAINPLPATGAKGIQTIFTRFTRLKKVAGPVFLLTIVKYGEPWLTTVNHG